MKGWKKRRRGKRRGLHPLQYCQKRGEEGGRREGHGWKDERRRGTAEKNSTNRRRRKEEPDPLPAGAAVETRTSKKGSRKKAAKVLFAEAFFSSIKY